MLYINGVDVTTAMTFAMDLTPLMASDPVDINAYVQGYIRRFAEDVTGRLARMG